MEYHETLFSLIVLWFMPYQQDSNHGTAAYAHWRHYDVQQHTLYNSLVTCCL